MRSIRIGGALVVLVAATVVSALVGYSSVTDDGRYVAFDSEATDLVPGDTNGAWDAFVRDRAAGTTERVSVGPRGAQANGESGLPAISRDGRVVAFWSKASNLVARDTNATKDVFVRDRAARVTELVSVGRADTQGNDESEGPSPALSADGRYVAFQSRASNLVPGDANRGWDVFVRDRATGSTERISLSGAEDNGRGDGIALSADGRYVAFQSTAANLVPGDANGGWDVFVRDRATGTTERVSLSGTQPGGRSHGLSMSADGRYVAFQSTAANLVAGDTNRAADVFVRDRVAGTTERVSVGQGGTQGNGSSGFPSTSADGRYVAFESDARNLVPGDPNGETDVFVRDRVRGTTELVSAATTGKTADEKSDAPTLSADGRVVVFWSRARDLVRGDTKLRPTWDVFARDRERRTTELVSVPVPPARAGKVSVRPDPLLAGKALVASMPITVGGKPASKATVHCSAVVVPRGAVVAGGDITLRAAVRRFVDGAASCRWTLPRDTAGTRIRGTVSARTPDGPVSGRFVVGVAGQPAGAALEAGRQVGTIVFTRKVRGAKPALYTVRPDGSGLRVLTRNASSPAVSWNGRRIAFVRDGAIWQMLRDGSAQNQLTRPRANEDWEPAWSPDGRTIYFSRSVNEGAIFSIHVDGKGLRCLSDSCTRSTTTQSGAAPSPDGRIIVYSNSFHGGGEDWSYLAATTPEGRKAELGFPDSVGTHQFSPAWAPGGRRLAFAAWDQDAISERGYQQQLVGSTGIYVAVSGASAPRRIARPTAWGARLDDPAWSRDGSWIAFTCDDADGRNDLWLASAGGGGARRVTSGTSDDGEPAWLPPAS